MSGTTMTCRYAFADARRQSGIVLITGLIFMVVLTLIVLAILRSATLEERMAANARNRQIALQAAEAVFRDVEDVLINSPAAPFDPYTPASFTSACTSGLCDRPADGSTPRWKTIDWTSTSVTRTFANANSNLTSSLVASQPRYIIEKMSRDIRVARGQICPMVDYRVTARGVGLDSSEVFVQGTYRARPAKC